MAVFKKDMGPTKKKIIFKNKIEIDVPNKKKFGGTHEFCFTNMKTVLQVCTKQARCFFLNKFLLRLSK